MHSHSQATSNACSGQQTHFVDLDIVLNDHTADSLTIRVTSTLDQNANDEAFGIQNVIVSPFINLVGKGKGPLVEGGMIDFSQDAGGFWLRQASLLVCCSLLLADAGIGIAMLPAVSCSAHTQTDV